MANTYTQIHIQTVFCVQNRESLIRPDWKNDLYKYITGIVQGNKHKLLIVNGMPDHIHLLIGLRTTQSLADLMKQIKEDSSKWINQHKFCGGKFSWQSGYGAFSYSKSELPRLIRYIENQQIHHQSKSFLEEYQELLEEFGIEYENQYLFHPVER